MKIIYKPLLYSFLILIISSVGIAYWYISDHLEYNATKLIFYKVSDIQIQSLKDIIIEIGLIGALIPTFLFISIYILKVKIKKVWLFSFLSSIMIAFAVIALYRFILYMIFHQFNTPIQFN